MNITMIMAMLESRPSLLRYPPRNLTLLFGKMRTYLYETSSLFYYMHTYIRFVLSGALFFLLG